MSYAPIVLFVYNRPQFTLRTLESLSANELAKESELFIYADGVKNNATPQQAEAVNDVRKIIRSREWCGKVTIIESEHNKGLANSVLAGAGEIINRYGRTIAIEDDVLVSRYFLRFMNEGLDKYKDEEKVLSLGSWNYYYETAPNDTYFIHLPDTIAWGSWKRAWDKVETDARKLYNELNEKNLMYTFNLDGRFPYGSMLEHQLSGKVNSWAIRLTASAFLNNTLTLYPSRSLSKHIGFGSDSTHVKSRDYNADLVLADSPIEIKDIPLEDSQEAIEAFIHFEKYIRPIKTSRLKYFTHLAKKLAKKVWLRKQ